LIFILAVIGRIYASLSITGSIDFYSSYDWPRPYSPSDPGEY